MPTTSQIHAMSYLQDMPTDRPFKISELTIRLTGGELCKLHYNKYIEVVGKYSSRGHNMNIWSVTKRGKALLATHPARIPTKIRPPAAEPHHLILAGTTKEQHRRDENEVAAYLSSHPDANTFDVALECHMGDHHALRLIKLVKSRRCHGLVPR